MTHPPLPPTRLSWSFWGRLGVDTVVRFRLNFGVFLRLFVQYLSSTEAESVSLLEGTQRPNQARGDSNFSILLARSLSSCLASWWRSVVRESLCRELFSFVIDVVRQIQTQVFRSCYRFLGWFVNLYKEMPPFLSDGIVIVWVL